MTEQTGWCPSCTCGWHKALDAFDVTPPEADCRNVSCDCHRSYWQSVDLDRLPVRLLPLACAWCFKVIWPWQKVHTSKSGTHHLHWDPCWLGVKQMTERDEEVTGI